MKYAIRICVSVGFSLLFFLYGGPASPMLSTARPAYICSVLSYEHGIDVQKKDYVAAGINSQAYAANGCYAPSIQAVAISQNQPKACKWGIQNIQAFLVECPAADNAYGLILHDTPVSFDATPVDPQTLATDVAAVCVNKTTLPSSGGPTLKQREEFRVVQALRTIYYMDSQGDKGCPYPWTGGRSFYKWMTSLEGGVEIRDDVTASYCCDYPVAGGTRPQLVIAMENPANEPNLDISPDNYTWMGILPTISIIGHETRHEPLPPSSNFSFVHVGCCPLGANACDQEYDEMNLTTYGLEFWLFRGALSGQLNVGYACHPDANTTLSFVGTANGFIPRFCTLAPQARVVPPNPGGTCGP